MNQRSRKVLDAQARVIEAQDSKFVAKLSGQNWKHSSASGRLSSLSRPITSQHDTQQPAQHAIPAAAEAHAAQAQQEQKPWQATTARNCKAANAPLQCEHRTTTPLRCVSPSFHPPDTRPEWHKAVQVAAHDHNIASASATMQDTDDQETSEPADPHHMPEAPCSPAQQTASAIVQAQKQQLVASTWLGSYSPQQSGALQEANAAYRAPSPGRPESPSWWLKAQAAGVQVQAKPLQVESSLYASWAHNFTAADPATAGGRVVSAPAAAAVMRGDMAHALPVPGSSTPAPLAQRSEIDHPNARAQIAAPTTGRQAASMTAAAAALLRCASPCSSNFCSSRAAGAAAGIAKPGMNLKYQSWLKGQYPGAKPPRREDAESVRLWLCQRLDQLQQQLQGGSQQQSKQQQPEQEEEEAAGQKEIYASHAADNSNQQHMQQAAQQILQSIQPQRLLQEQQDNLLKQRTRTSLQPCDGSNDDPSEAAETEGATSSGLCWLETGLEAQTSQLLLMARLPSGALDIEQLQQQEAIYSAVFNELCRQVSVQCVERGHLMAKLWLAVRAMVLAAMDDRQAARVSEQAAHAATAAARHEAERLQQLQEDERVALRAICERHAAKAEAAKQELGKSQKKYEQLQDLLQRLSAAQELVQRVMDLESSNVQQQTTINTLQQKLFASEQRVEETSTQLAAWQARGSKAEQRVAELQEQLGVSTPRPSRDLGLLMDLLGQGEARLVEQALIAGVPAQHVHRLLLGLSTEGDDVRPWVELAGRSVAALQAAADPYKLHQQMQQYLVSCDAAGLARHVSPADSIQLVSQAVHMGATPQLIMQLLDGSLGLPGAAGQLATTAARMAAANIATATAGAGAVRVSSAARCPAVDSQQGIQQAAASQPVQEAACSGIVKQSMNVRGSSTAGNGVSEQQLAVLAPIGAGMPYVLLVGVLATRYGHDANELGGPVTEALVHAQLSTKAHMHDLESGTKAMHREVVLLKRTLAEQRKQEQERIHEALKDQKRKIARREARQPSLLDKFLQTKWGDYFIGIGLMEELPRVLRANVPINNKRMPKREAEKLAREIWQAKDEQEAAGAPCQHLTDITAAFLERRYFAIPRLVQEVAYNFIYSLGLHSYDADCNLFLRVFTGDVEETVRTEQQALEEEIMKLLKLLDVSINNQATGWLHKADVKTALAGFFKGKSVDRLSEIYEALDTDEPGDALHYPGLFCDDDDFNQGMTAETIRSQHLQERLEFLQEVEDSIRDAAEDNQSTNLTAAMLRSCLEKTSRMKDPATLDAFVSRAFGPDWQQQQHRLAQPLGQVIRATRRGSLQTAMRATAATAATAVSRIAPVGKFKAKLMSALKVGLNESAPASSRRVSNTNGGAAAGTAWTAAAGGGATSSGTTMSSSALGASLTRRRSTNNEITLLGSTAAAPAASVPVDPGGGHIAPGRLTAKPRRVTSDAVSAAVAAVLAGGGGGSTGVRQSAANRQVVVAAAAGATSGTAGSQVGSTLASSASSATDRGACTADGGAFAADGGACTQDEVRPCGGDSAAVDGTGGLRRAQAADTKQLEQPGADDNCGGLATLQQQQQGGGSVAKLEQAEFSLRLLGSFKETAAAVAAVSSINGSSSRLPAIHSSRGNISSSGSVKHTNADAATAARSPAASTSGGSAASSRSSASSSIVANAISDAAPVTALLPCGSARSGNGGPSSSRLGMNGSAATAAAAALSANHGASGMTVGMLSAMEAVRQSWLKEEEEKIIRASLSGTAAAGGSHASSPTAKSATARARLASFFLASSSGATGSAASSVACTATAQHAGGSDSCFAAGGEHISNAVLSFSIDGGYRTGAAFKIPDIPALRLEEVPDADGTDVTHRTSGRTTESARDYGAASQRGIRPILRQMDSAKLNRRAHISIILPGDNGQEACSSPGSPAGAVLQHAATNRTICQEAGRAGTAAISFNGRRDAELRAGLSSPRSPASAQSAGRISSAVAGRVESGAAGSCTGTRSRRSSIRKPQPPALMLTDADDTIAACQHVASVSCSGGTILGTDAVDHDVCFTPHAPAEGGKKNAYMMRKIAKGKSLKRLEEVMLMVASQAADVAGADWS